MSKTKKMSLDELMSQVYKYARDCVAYGNEPTVKLSMLSRRFNKVVKNNFDETLIDMLRKDYHFIVDMDGRGGYRVKPVRPEKLTEMKEISEMLASVGGLTSETPIKAQDQDQV